MGVVGPYRAQAADIQHGSRDESSNDFSFLWRVTGG
jgi:hypothetical protein